VPAHKNQHYVPRCALRPFSLNGEGLAINLYNITHSRCIKNAPLKNQCAKDYFYGKDLRLERALQGLEGNYDQLVRALGAGEIVAADGLAVLRFFTYVQQRRTDIAAQRLKTAETEFADAVFKGPSAHQRPVPFTDAELIRSSMEICLTTTEYIDDLKIKVVRNRTPVSFVVSDDPVVFANKYAAQRADDYSFGISSSGVILFMPVTPSLCAVCYDGKVYTIPDSAVTDVRDVATLNELQYLNAAKNIYFADWGDAARIATEFEAVRPRRLDSRCVITRMVSAGTDQTGSEYFRVAEEPEWLTARSGMIAVSFRYPQPAEWPRFIKYRHNVTTYSNGSAIGDVRKPEWLQSRRGPRYGSTQ
jgi:hypothetical protein